MFVGALKLVSRVVQVAYSVCSLMLSMQPTSHAVFSFHSPAKDTPTLAALRPLARLSPHGIPATTARPHSACAANNANSAARCVSSLQWTEADSPRDQFDAEVNTARKMHCHTDTIRVAKCGLFFPHFALPDSCVCRLVPDNRKRRPLAVLHHRIEWVSRCVICDMSVCKRGVVDMMKSCLISLSVKNHYCCDRGELRPFANGLPSSNTPLLLDALRTEVKRGCITVSTLLGMGPRRGGADPQSCHD
jgi:hypothetical protein